MYNNEVTYDEKHNTDANKAALTILEKKYFDMSECSPDCPVAWAPEVLELMDTLQAELGFMHNEKTIRGYYIKGNLVEWFLKDPWKNLFSAFKSNIFGSPSDYDYPRDPVTGNRPKKNMIKRFKAIIEAFFHSMQYGVKAVKVMYINPRLNKFQRNKITLGQLKEKFGELRCYFHVSEAYSEYVEKEIRKCEIKLALKGVYYPIEGFWDAAVSYNIENDYRPDSVTVTYGEYKGERTVNLKETKYRGVMKELGLDLKEIEAKATARKAAKEAEANAKLQTQPS